MQLLHVASSTLLAAAALLMPGGTSNSARCWAEESWEQHAVITPIPLVAEPEVRDSRAESNKLRSLTGLSETISAAVPASPFPLSCPVLRYSYYSRRRWGHDDPPAPILLKVLFGKTGTPDAATTSSHVSEEWCNAWDEPPDGEEWSPLKLAFPVVVDRAVPEQLVSHATIEEQQDWHRFRFILPHEVRSVYPNGSEPVTFELGKLFLVTRGSWLERLSAYTFVVDVTTPQPSFENTVRHGCFVDYELVEVNAIKIIEDYGQKESAAEQTFFRPLLIDKWIGKDEPETDETRVFRWFYQDIVR